MPFKHMSTRRFNSISPRQPEVINNFVPVAVITVKSTAEVVSTVELKNGMWTLTLDKLADDNVTVKMECGLHTMWTVTVSYEDAKSIYNYYKKGWK